MKDVIARLRAGAKQDAESGDRKRIDRALNSNLAADLIEMHEATGINLATWANAQ